MSIQEVLLKLNEKRYEQLRLFNTVPSNPEEGDRVVMPLELLVMSENSLRQSLFNDISVGRYSMTKGDIDVWFTEEDFYFLTDGYHRVVEAMLLGKEEMGSKVEGVGYSTYWAVPSERDRFEYRPNMKYKGLEKFAEEGVLDRYREELENHLSRNT